MADIDLKSFPFDSMKVLNEQSNELEDDRLYEAQIFRDYFRKFLSNGVYYGNYKNYGENSMQVVLDTGLTIKVKKGCGIIEGVDYENESDRLITLDRPASGSRVDRVVVQMNSSLDTRKTKLIVKQGSGTTPAELTRTDNVYEICIAEVTVSSSSNLTDESIVDKRLDTTLCGIVNSLISVEGEELYEQFQEYVQSVEENMMLKNEDIVDDLVSTDTDKALSAKQGKELNEKKADISNLVNLVYPIGSIYMSVNNINPGTLFGGTWVAWGAGRVPVGVSSESEFNSVEKTGGEKTHELTKNEMPLHRHGLNGHTHSFSTSSSNAGGFTVKLNALNSVNSDNLFGGTEGLASVENSGTGYYNTTGRIERTNTMNKLIVENHAHNVSGTTGEANGNTEWEGSIEAHNNLQPYITCYMWKRTA